jgi:MFS family permease
MLLAARATQGVGAALAAPAALALLTTIFPEGPARIRAIGLFTTVSAAGGALGLVAGGMLTEWLTWRSVMFVNVPIGIAVILIGLRALSETPRRRGHFDVAGALTSTLGMTAVVMGLVEAGIAGWAKFVTVGPLIAGVALLVLFTRIERTATEPILPLRILADRTRLSANLARGFGYAGMYGIIFFLTQFFQDIQGRSSIITGLAFLPTPMSVFLASQFTSRVLVTRVSAKSLMMVGTAMSATGLLLATQLLATASYAQIVVSLVLIGAGMGVSFVTLTSAGLAGVDPRDSGAASGLINVMQQLGAALGLAILVTVFNGATTSAHSAGLSQAVGATGAAAAALRTSLVHGLDVTFAAGAGFALLAFAIVALFVQMPVRAEFPVSEPSPALAEVAA